MAEEKELTLAEEAGLDPNWQPINAAPIVPGQPTGAPPQPTTTSPYLSGVISPTMQYQPTFLGTETGKPRIPSYPLSPLGPSGMATNNSAIQSYVKPTTTTTTVSSGITWKGNWVSTTSYAKYDVVQFNISTYLALSANTNVEPDGNPSVWVLVSKNLNLRQYVLEPSTAAFVQAADSRTLGATGGTLAFSGNNTAGNFIVAIVESAGNSASPSSPNATFAVTDSQGNTYQQVSGPVNSWYSGNEDSNTVSIFIAYNIKSGANTATLMVTSFNSPLASGMTLLEYTGAGNLNPFITAQDFGTLVNPSPTTIAINLTTTQPGQIAIIYTVSGSLTTPSSGGTSRAAGCTEFTQAIPGPVHYSQVGGDTMTISGVVVSNVQSGASSDTYYPSDVVIWNDGTTYLCIQKAPPGILLTNTSYWAVLSQGTGSVVSLTSSFSPTLDDSGALITNPSSSAFTITLPNPPFNGWWWISFQQSGPGTLTISPNSLLLDGSSSSITLNQNQGLSVYTDGINYFTMRGSGGSGSGGVNEQTVSYLATASDGGKLISMNGSGLTLTLPATPPSTTWSIVVENIAVSNLTVSRNGLTIDGAASNLLLTQNQGVLIYTDGSNYFTERGLSASSGGVNSKTANYLALSGDSGKLISMNGSGLTLTLPATPPSPVWWISVENTNSTNLTLSPNGLNLDGGAASLTIPQNQGVLVYTDGTNYFTERGISFVNPMTTLGDIIYENSTPAPARLAGNITSATEFLTSTGSGSTNGYTASQTISIDHTKVGSSNSTSFPMLFSGTYAYLAGTGHGGSVTNSSGYDIIFTSDALGTTLLNWEIESYNNTTGAVNFWVNISTLSHTVNTVIYLWYGNSSVSTFQGGATGTTWTSSFKSVYHLENGSVLSGADSTSNAVTLALENTPTATTGEVDGGAAFVSSSSQYMGAASSPVTTYPLTLEGWAKLSTTTFSNNQERVICALANAANLNEFWISYYNDLGTIVIRAVAQQAGTSLQHYATVPTLDTNFHHIVGVFTSTASFLLYFDGVLLSTATVGSAETPVGIADTFVGGFVYNGATFYGGFDGTLDEIRVSNISVGADWTKATFNSISSPSTFYSLTAGSPGVATAPAWAIIKAANLPDGIWNFNQAAQSQTVVSATPYYITHSDLDMPSFYTTPIAAGTTFKWRIAMTKTAAGTGTFQIVLYQGPNGSTSDTANATITIGTQTAVADDLILDILIVFTSTTAFYYSVIPVQSAGSATGFGLTYPAAAAQFSGTVTGLVTTNPSTKYGVGFIATTGTPTIVVNFVSANAYGVN